MNESRRERHINYLQEKWGKRSPFVKLFQTRFGNYLYDPGTNKVLKCNDGVYAAIDLFRQHDVGTALARLGALFEEDVIEQALEEITDTMERESILLADPSLISFDSLHFSRLETELAENLGQVILEVTEECNLRCSYCVYNDIVGESRNHGTARMAFPTAQKAMDYLAARSSRQRTPSVTFYGGEPLLRFDFIRRCVAYARTVFRDKEVQFAVTTNGTTVTEEIARFLVQNEFGVTVSIDGPEEIHDGYRVFPDGKGSFAPAMKGLRTLVDAYGEKAQSRINLSMVYTPPFSSARLDAIASLWRENPWLGDIYAGITYPHDGSIPVETVSSEEDLIEDKSLSAWGADFYFENYHRNERATPLAKSFIDRGLLKIFRRPIFDAPVRTIHLNGCCVPGARKIFVAAAGGISMCERVHRAAPELGHVDTGIDPDRVKSVFVTEYAEKSLPQCARCWAHRLCGICYTDAYTNRVFDDSRKVPVCEGVVRTVEEQLKLYTMLLHVNPEGLNHLADVVVT